MTLNVVRLRDSPSLNDLPGQLRQLADKIERGEVEGETAICIVPQATGWPLLYGWGPQFERMAIVGILETAKLWFIEQQKD